MAQIQESGGRKSLNAEMNLVPFIDLLSVCICFLLMAAVWLQVGSVQVKQSYGTEASDPDQLIELDVHLTGAAGVRIDAVQAKKTLLSFEAKGSTKAEMVKALTEQLTGSIATLRGAKTVKVAELIGSATIHPVKEADYGTLVAVMDALRKQEIVNLAVVPAPG